MAVNPDLQKERDTCSFRISELTALIHGGADRAKRYRKLGELVAADPVLREGDYHRVYLDASQRYDRALHKFVRFMELRERYKWTEEEEHIVLSLIRYDIGLVVHPIMFIPAIEKLSSEEQKRVWLPLAKSFKIIGAYAQTELGHGTDLRHLETRCDYDRKLEEFIINTPHTSSMKWWPGGMGLSANHILLLAQLYIDGESHGMQPFLVQIRDMETHVPLPGVEVGDIGPTMSSAVSDNGYLVLKNIRIPRTNMLMKYNEVTADGRFIKKGSDRSTYGTMIFIRANICGTAWRMLSLATTIATRYSAVRRQTELKPGAPEPQVLDYQTQQMKLFPAMAATFAIKFTHLYMIETYNQITHQMAAGDSTRLPELHIQAAGFKAFTTDMSSECIEVLRRSAGGHGYLLSSGLPFTLFEISGAVTYEGENTVLYLQVARYLMKQLANAQSGTPVEGSLHYLSGPLSGEPLSDRDALCMGHVDIMLRAFSRRTHYFLEVVGQAMQRDLISGLQSYEVWNKNLVNLVRVAKMYLDGCVVSIFHEAMSSADASPELKLVLFHLFYFHMVHRIVSATGDFLECRAFTVAQIQAIKREEIRVLALLRPDAVGIMDAFDYTDDVLVSTLGRYDGNAYEALYDSAKQSPLNKDKVHPAVVKHLLPLMRKSQL